MDKVLNFLSANYIYFLIGSVVLLLFLIGYIVVEKKNKKKEEKVNTPAEAPVTMPAENTTPVEPMQTTQADNTTVVEPTVEAPSLDAFNSNVTETPTAGTPSVEQTIVQAQPVSEPTSIFDAPDTNAQMEQVQASEPVMETPVVETPTLETATPQDVVMETAPVDPVEEAR